MSLFSGQTSPSCCCFASGCINQCGLFECQQPRRSGMSKESSNIVVTRTIMLKVSTAFLCVSLAQRMGDLWLLRRIFDYEKLRNGDLSQFRHIALSTASSRIVSHGADSQCAGLCLLKDASRSYDSRISLSRIRRTRISPFGLAGLQFDRPTKQPTFPSKP